MRKLNSLIKKEWHEHKFGWIIVLLIALLAVGIFPLVLEKMSDSKVASGEVRIPMLFCIIVSLMIVPIFQLLTSLNRDIKQKDVWLHNSSSIYTLIGAKWLFTLFALVITSFISFLGFFLLGDYLNGSVGQIWLLIGYYVGLEVFIYFTLSNLALLFYAFYLQLKRYVGQFSLFIVFIAVILFFWLLNSVPEKFIQIPYGKIPPNWVNENLPTFTESEIFVDVNIYLLDVIFPLLLIFISAKWIEKVITR